MYLASGKAIVTQPSFSLPEATPPPPMLTSFANNPQDVANAITKLADDESLRNTLASDSRTYYMKYLGHERIASDWRKLLARFSTKQHDIE
jgi:glycosyltransferase involved in cell wall biosynthesis